MVNQGVKTFVPGYHMEESAGVFRGPAPDLIGNMEVERIRSDTRDLYVFCSRTKLLKCRCNFKRDFRLVGTTEQQHMEVLVVQCFDRVGLHAFKIYQYNVPSHLIAAPSFCHLTPELGGGLQETIS